MRFERILDPSEQILELEDVMQRLIRNDGVVLGCGIPFVKIPLNKVQVGADAILLGGVPASFQHVWIQIETIDDEIVVAGKLVDGKPRLVSRSQLPEPMLTKRLRSFLRAWHCSTRNFWNIPTGLLKPKASSSWPHMPVRPVMKNVGQTVYFETIPIDSCFRGKTRSVKSVHACCSSKLRNRGGQGHAQQIPSGEGHFETSCSNSSA